MPKSGRRRRGRKNRNVASDMLAAAIALALLGAFFFVASFLLASNSNPAIRAMAPALRKPALIASIVGGVALAVFFIVRRIARSRAEVAPAAPRVWFPTTGAAYLNVADEYQAPAHDTVASVPIREAETQWNERVFDQIEWRRFEAVCEALFAQAGFETKTQSHGADGGVDIWLHSRHADGAPVAVVQCKHWRGQPVGVKPVRELFGVMSSLQLKRGTFATSSRFTDEALKFAKANGISTLDRDGLLALISRREPEQQQMLLEVAYEGEYWRPTCANCGIKMVERIKRGTHDAFWGCANYPRCRATLAKRD